MRDFDGAGQVAGLGGAIVEDFLCFFIVGNDFFAEPERFEFQVLVNDVEFGWVDLVDVDGFNSVRLIEQRALKAYLRELLRRHGADLLNQAPAVAEGDADGLILAERLS